MSDYNESKVRAKIRAWLEENWNPGLRLLDWRKILVDSGWGMPQWPKEWYGRDLPVGFLRVIDEEFKRVDAITVARKGATTLAGSTILAHGSDMLREKFLRRSLTGEYSWCQLFSEPGNGSDLAGAMTRAERQGNKFVVNGQKVWTTSAHIADFGLLLARTNLDVPKHRGLSYFIINMRQPGVKVVPLRQMNGHASFNQVFMVDAEIAPEFLLENEGDGWKIATTTLMHERRNADSNRRKVEPTNRPGQIYLEEEQEIATSMAPYTWYPQRAGRTDLLIERAKETGRNKDPVVRQEIAKVMTMAKSAEWMSKRARAAHEKGRPPGPEGSLGKLAASEVARAANSVHTMISEADVMLTGDDSPKQGLIAEVLVSTPAISIAGGTDEIQKNIISERLLKMPKEVRFDTDRPYRVVPKNALPEK